MGRLALEYFILVFVAAVGVLQGVAAGSRLRGLLFWGKPALGYLFAALAVGGAFAWFFAGEGGKPAPGLEGAQQVALFSGAGLAALLFTLAVSSLVKGRELSLTSPKPERGLEALQEMTYFQALGLNQERSQAEDVRRR